MEETDALLLLAQAAKAARLSPADEERATALLTERLSGGKAGITAALAPMIDGLPWIVCVNAVSAVWEKLSAPMRRHLLGSIAKSETEPARRLRLSLARALFKLEPAAGLKLAAAACADLRHPETGALTAKYRQFFFNIFIGKGKPWLLQLPLGDLKPGEADTLVHCAIECLPLCPPLSQLSLLRWAEGAGRLKKVSAADLEAAAKGVARWNAKLQRQLKSEIAELPAALEAVLKPEALQPEPESAPEAAKPEQPKRGESKKAQRTAGTGKAPKTTGEPEIAAEPAAPVEELVIPGRAERLAQNAGEKLANKRPEPEPRKAERPERGERAERAARSFDVKEALRGVESYVASLRSELEQAKAQLSRQNQEGKRGGRSSRAAEEMPSAEAEALTRHNARLEATVADLRAQLEDLAAHHETVAESRQLHTDAPLPEGEQQLKALLAIQLQESYVTYEAMRLEPLDKVFRLDYRDLLGSVFETLANAGVALKKG
ncbi:MAG: hypothetical protein WCO68_06930 [Verrucomicrobiota bacterium]